MYAIGNGFYRHILQGIHALNGARHLKLVLLIHHWHCIIEVGGVGHARMMCCLYRFKGGVRTGEGGEHPMTSASLNKLDRARQLWSLVPTFDARIFVEQWLILLGFGCFAQFGVEHTRLSAVQIGAFNMQTKHGAIFLVHQLLAYFTSRFYHRHCRC